MTVQPSRPGGNLSACWSRLDRAGEHIAELRGLHAELLLEQREYVARNTKAGRTASGLFIVTDLGERHVPRRVGLLVGDTVQDLRSALDYLVFALSGGQRGTQFPIDDRESDFLVHRDGTGKRSPLLAGLDDATKERIRELQPFVDSKKNRWLAHLRDLSNIDKHRHLNVVMRSARLSLSRKQEQDGVRIMQALKLELVLADADHEDVIELLSQLHTQVSRLLASFESGDGAVLPSAPDRPAPSAPPIPAPRP